MGTRRELRHPQKAAQALLRPVVGPPPPTQPSTHQLQLFLLLFLETGEVLGQVGPGELVLQAPSDAQHLPGDAVEGQRDLVHQLPVTWEIILGCTAQVRPVAPGDRFWGEATVTTLVGYQDGGTPWSQSRC